MGCTRSKLEPDEDGSAAAAAGAGTIRSGRRPRGADVSGRKGGFVAAAELLCLPEEPDAGDEAESPETEGTKGDAEGEERRGPEELRLGLGFVGDRRRGAAEEEEDDLPGSPSFRFYFDPTPLTGSGDGDDDSALKENGKDKPISAKGKDNSHRQEECVKTLKRDDEESECKSQKREKGWRFKVLTKKNSDAHNNN